MLLETSLGGLGLALLVSRSKIFQNLRQLLPNMLGCLQCFGFYAGLVAGMPFLDVKFTLLNALIVSGMGYLINRQYPPLEGEQKWVIWDKQTNHKYPTE